MRCYIRCYIRCHIRASIWYNCHLDMISWLIQRVRNLGSLYRDVNSSLGIIWDMAKPDALDPSTDGLWSHYLLAPAERATRPQGTLLMSAHSLMLFNHKKSVILICRSKYMKNVYPVFTLNGKIIDESDTVRYLGHTSKEPVCPRVELILKIIITCILLIIFLGFIKSKPC